MRRRAIDDKATISKRIPAHLLRDAHDLADALNEADKPHGYPLTNVSKSNSQPQQRKVTTPHALALAVALVLDMLDDGEITHLDLLKRSALLEETDPAKERIRQALRDEEKIKKITT